MMEKRKPIGEKTLKNMDKANALDVSVIIVNYKTTALVADSIRSVIEHTHGVSYEVIVVDNDSDPLCDTVLYDAFPGFDGLTVMKLNENIGFGKANNEGVKISKGRNVFFLNPDTLLINDVLTELSRFLDGHPEAGVAGPNIYQSDGTPRFSFSRTLPGLFLEFDTLFSRKISHMLYGLNFHFNHTGKPMNVGFVSGAAMIMRRNDFDAAGGFSPEYFMYYDETDLCLRVKRMGLSRVNVPTAELIHYEGASMDSGGGVNEFREEHMEKGHVKIYERNFSGFERKLCLSLYGFYLASRTLFKRKGARRAEFECKRKFFMLSKRNLRN